MPKKQTTPFRVAVVHVVDAKDSETAVRDVIGKVARKEITEVHIKNIDTNEQGFIAGDDLVTDPES